jgi:hypothetical protein
MACDSEFPCLKSIKDGVSEGFFKSDAQLTEVITLLRERNEKDALYNGFLMALVAIVLLLSFIIIYRQQSNTKRMVSGGVDTSGRTLVKAPAAE